MDINDKLSGNRLNSPFSWFRGEPSCSNMYDNVDIYYCVGSNYRAFRINRGIIGDKDLDYTGDYSFLRGGYGIYFLYGIEKTPTGQTIHVYVGKAEDRVRPHGMDRLVEHINNDEKAGLKYANKWNKALYITIKEDKDIPEFNPGVIKALESAFIAMFKGLEQRISEEKKATNRVICYNVKTGEPSNEPFDKYKTHIHAIINLLAHNGIRIIPEQYIGAFAAESKVEEMQTLIAEVSRLNKALHEKTIEAEEAKRQAIVYDVESKELEELRLKKKFKEAQETYFETDAIVVNGRIYTATNLLNMTKSSIVITPLNVTSDMVNLVPANGFTMEDKTLFLYSKDGAFVKSALDRAINDETLSDCGKTPIERLRYFFGYKTCIVVPNTDCYNLTMKNVLGHYIERLQQLDPMWAFDVNNCVLPSIIVISNLETLVKTIDGRVFIRQTLQERFGTVKFDVVIGNPPYNNDIYLDFVTLADQLASQATCMITPAKWQAKTDGKPKGSKTDDKNETFRKNIVPRMSDIIFYTDTHEIFDIAEWGGISYFLIDKDTHLIKNIKAICSKNSALASETEEHDETSPILLPRKILQIIGKMGQLGEGFKQSLYVKNTDHGEPCLMGQLGFKRQTFTGEQDRGELKPCGTDYVEVMQGEKVVGYRQIRDLFTTLNLDKWKCITSIIVSGSCSFDSSGYSQRYINIYKIAPYQVPKGSFPVLKYFDSEDGAKSFISYFDTKLIKFLTILGICGTTLTREFFRFVPDPGNFDHIFTDKELYDKYNLTPEEIAIIESIIKERK